MMKLSELIVCLMLFLPVFTPKAWAEEAKPVSKATVLAPPIWKLDWGMELGSFFVFQKNGNSFTVLPGLDLKFFQIHRFSITALAGATVVKTTNQHSWIASLRLAPSLALAEGGVSIELPMGLQWWESVALKADLGARVNIPVSIYFLDHLYLGGGWLSNPAATTYYTNFGVQKWF